ncbi:methyl-accepting chemotaxis protein [Clostridium tyrobutyricum]|uniref:methyl-accepting chemotaxis protein n=1 Tax=Clostridium tyrobutyricum TaxID=1519 RepID=UPI002B20F24D|nr:methyl-accepting chemotaxis protein [Clostridium tyrobutyricum]MEA5009049.1 methyl-accepting chemotaxis protein [Clostridium tyrobutyricum]
MKLTIRKKLFLGFGVTLLLMFLLSALGLYEIKEMNHNVEDMYKQVTAVNYIKDAQFNVAKVQRAEKSVLLASTLEEKKEHIMHIDEAYDEGITKNLNMYKALPHARNIDKIDSIIESVNSVRRKQQDIIDKSMNNKNEEALALSNQNSALFKSIENEISNIAESSIQVSEQKHNDSMKIYSSIIKSVILITIAALILSIVLTILISSSIVKPLQRSIAFAKNLADGDLTDSLSLKSKDELGVLTNALNITGMKLKEIVTKIKSTSLEINLGSEQLASALESASSSTSDIGTKIINVSDNIQDIAASVEGANNNLAEISLSSNNVSSLAEEAKNNSLTFREHANKGKNSVDITVSAMNHIENATKEVKSTISDLYTLSNKIGDITSMISNIAKQTNMLALNAAIEAARAGEQGKGFSVVADQVKKLAEESASAAMSIESMILEVKSKTDIAVKNISITEVKVKEGTSVASDTEAQINSIIENMNTLVNNFEKIFTQVHSQALSTENISQNMNTIVENVQLLSTVSQDINSNIEEQIAVTEEITTTSETLSNMAENLNSMVDYFKV